MLKAAFPRWLASLCKSSLLFVAVVAAAAPLIAAWAMRWTPLATPLVYEGDFLFVWTLVKSLATHPWVFHVPELGLPGDASWINFPMSFLGQVVVLKALTMAGLAPVAAINVFFYITCAATAATGLWALRRLQVGPMWAALGALVYTLLPYHFLRVPNHLFLAAYVLVPFYADELLSLTLGPARMPRRYGWRLVGCGVAAMISDVYYTFFFCYFVAFIALFCLLDKAQWRLLGRAVYTLISSLVGLCLALAPTLWSSCQTGQLQTAVARRADDSETYGLKLMQMLVPPAGHDNAFLARMTQAYEQLAPLINENTTASLGLIGAAALIVTTIAWLKTIAPRTSDASLQKMPDLLQQRFAVCGFLSLAAFLFGTIGGLGSVFAYSVTPYIRSTNRIVVFLAFFVIAAAMLLLTRAQAAKPFVAADTIRLPRAWLWAGCFVGLCGVLLWDVRDAHYFPQAAQAGERAAKDRAYFESVEAALPRASAIFQLPYVAFPEGGFQRADYSQFTPYIHTAHLRFSFGAIRGTNADKSNKDMANGFAAEDWTNLAERLRTAGFTHVLVNQRVPINEGLKLFQRLQDKFSEPMLRSEDDEFVLYAIPATG